MPRELEGMGIYSVQKWSAVKGANVLDWRIITERMNCVLHEPIICSIRFDGFCMKYAGLKTGMSKLGESVHYHKLTPNSKNYNY